MKYQVVEDKEGYWKVGDYFVAYQNNENILQIVELGGGRGFTSMHVDRSLIFMDSIRNEVSAYMKELYPNAVKVEQVQDAKFKKAIHK
jgi:hypothetical protein